MKLADRLETIHESQTLAITAKAAALRKQGLRVLSLSAGEPDFDTPDYVQEAAIQAIRSGFTHYTPNNGIPELKEAIAAKFLNENGASFRPDEILVSNGGKHSIANFFLAILNPGDEVIIPAPYWVSYPEIVKLAQGVPVIVSADWKSEFKITPAQLERAITPKTRVFVLNSPSNPTGAVYTPEEIKALCRIAVKNDVVILSDEIYEHLIFNGVTHFCPASDPEFRDHSVIVNGVSKVFAMTGWRIGYMAGNKALIDGAAKIQSQTTSNPCSVSQKASLAAITAGPGPVRYMYDAFLNRRSYIIGELSKMPYVNLPHPGGAFYVFPDLSGIIGKRYNGQEVQSINQFCEILIGDFRIAAVPGDAFGAPHSLRFSYATSMEVLEEAMSQFRSALGALS
ncbi:MAG: pyridoxal phosphate-dependent aminotransferase [Bacteroidetes bacterium]|nr:pyridoxal phosphate-dependent aminotransferase [Bacteroidota bacterium]